MGCGALDRLWMQEVGMGQGGIAGRGGVGSDVTAAGGESSVPAHGVLMPVRFHLAVVAGLGVWLAAIMESNCSGCG